MGPFSRKQKFDNGYTFNKDCWEWKSGYPYGKFEGNAAHRTAYELYVMAIEAGTHIHHICRNKICVNPEHLDMLTPEEHAYEHVDDRKEGKRKARKLREIEVDSKRTPTYSNQRFLDILEKQKESIT